jgi:hypothetical protein
MGEDMTPDEHLAMAEELLRDPPKAGELVNSVYQRQVTALWHLGLAHLAAIRARQATPDGPRTWALPDDRAQAKAAIHRPLHDLNVRIVGLAVGDCHCNLIAEVVLDALTDATPAADGRDGDGRG